MRKTTADCVRALNRASRAMRHGKPAEARTWMDLYERQMRSSERFGQDERAEERHQSFLRSQGLREVWLANRNRFQR